MKHRKPLPGMTVQDLWDMLHEMLLKDPSTAELYVVLEGCDCSATLVGFTPGLANSGLGLAADKVLWLRQDSGVFAELGARIQVPTFNMDFAESFGLGIFCESCKDAPIAVAKWDFECKKWVDEDDQPYPVDLKALPCITCGRMYPLPTEAQVARFDAAWHRTYSRRTK